MNKKKTKNYARDKYIRYVAKELYQPNSYNSLN